MVKYNGLDQWALNQYNRIEFAETAHHIVPTTDDESLFFVLDNLIPVSRRSHDEIHTLYKMDKVSTQTVLKDIVTKKNNGGGAI